MLGRNERSCRNRSRIVVVEVIVEPVVVPVPLVVVPVQVTDMQFAIGVAVSYTIPSTPLSLEAYAILGLYLIWDNSFSAS